MNSFAYSKARLFGFWACVVVIVGGCASDRPSTGPGSQDSTVGLWISVLSIVAALAIGLISVGVFAFVVPKFLWLIRSNGSAPKRTFAGNWLGEFAREIVASPAHLRNWWNGVEVQRPSPLTARSLAYDNLVRSQLLVDPTVLGTAELVPHPFQEAFEHPRSRVDVDASWFAADLLGRIGLAVSVIVVLLTLLLVALATGVYQQPAKTTVPPSQKIDSAVSQGRTPRQ